MIEEPIVETAVEEPVITDYFLKFDSKEIAEAVVGVQGEGLYRAVDHVGTIMRPTGEVEMVPQPIYGPVPGYHVNVRTEATAPELMQYRVFPKNPARVWA